MPSFNVEDDISINSDIIWSFFNVQEQLLNKFPSGKCFSERLSTINGLEWQIDLYPNGKDKLLAGSMVVELTLLKMPDDSGVEIDAECHWSLVNKNKGQNYVGGIKRKHYTLNHSEVDSDFDNSLLKDCSGDCQITIGVLQYIADEEEASLRKESASNVASTTKNSDVYDDEDFKKTTVNPLY